MKYFQGLSIHHPDWDGWLRLTNHSFEYSNIFDGIGFKAFLESRLEAAPASHQPSAKLLLEGIDCVLEEFSAEASRWTKIERLQSVGFGVRELSIMLQGPVSELLGEEAILLKDKVNINPPGLSGFPVHQDFESYRHYPPKVHVTVMIPFDAIDSTNGCMYFAKDYKKNIIKSDISEFVGKDYLLNIVEDGPLRGNVEQSIVNKMTYRDAELSFGDSIFFDSFVPHGSRHNMNRKHRFALFLTFCPARFEFGYGEYYAQRFAGLI